MKTLVLACFLCSCGSSAWSADYLRDGPDSQNTGWLRNEKVFTPANVKDTKLLWKMKLDTTARVKHNLFPPLIVESVKTTSGNKQIAVVAGVSDDLFAIDADAGTLLWTKHFDAEGEISAGVFCPGGQVAVPVIAPASEAGEYTLYALAGDGRLWQVNVANGENVAPPAKFIPPNAKAWALNLFEGVVYSTSAQGCGDLPYAFFSYDLATGKSSAFVPAGGGLWGRRGPSVAPDGTVFMGTGDGPFDPENGQLGNAIVAVKLNDEKELKLTGYYAPGNANYNWLRDLDFNISPMIFDYNGRHWVLNTGKECRLLLSDRDKFGGADHRTETVRTLQICNDDQAQTTKGVWGAPAERTDASGNEWIYLPFWGPVSMTFHAPIEYGRPQSGAVAAFQMKDTNGKVTIEPKWLSADIVSAEEVIFANGVVFTYGSGERQTRLDRAWDDPPPPDPRTAHAVMYALDATTGKELWNSGDAIATTNHFSGMSLANGRAYIGTVDSMIYCFGVAK
jgi:hypothetical protein